MATTTETPVAQSEAPPPTSTSNAVPSAALPPEMERHQYTNTDDLLKELNRIPLFMTELDETDGAGGENAELEALKALAYEGTRAEIAGNFREQGNECARERRWLDAREFYSKALAALTGAAPVSDEGPPEINLRPVAPPAGSGKVLGEVYDDGLVDEDDEEEKRRERAIEEACYVNRALCNLELKNYGSCNRDCAAALKLNAANVKAFYRSAQACLALDKLEAAMDSCRRALAIEPRSAAVEGLISKIEARRAWLAQVQKMREEREGRKQREAAALKQALRDRRIAFRITNDAPDVEDAKLELANPIDPQSTLSIPTLLLYPTHAQSDMIKAFEETNSIEDHLSYILPCPWDEDGEFTADGVDCFMDTTADGLVKVGKRMALRQILSGGKVEVKDSLCRIYVIPKARVADWIAEMKRRKGR